MFPAGNPAASLRRARGSTMPASNSSDQPLSATGKVTDGKLFPPGDYVVRLGTFLPNDFDTVTVTIPK